ncbi:MAG: hypothetical protein WCP89_00415 [archaeon]
MNTKTFLVPILAVIALMLVGLASAGNLANGVAVSFNDVSLGSSTTMTGFSGDVIPVRVTFDAAKDMGDVRVKVSVEGTRDSVDAATARFDIISGNTYTKLLSLKLPADLKDTNQGFTLYVEVVSAEDRTERTYTISLQRESYTLNVLSVDYNSAVSAGEVFPISVVIKNLGFQRTDDTYVVASIPALGISSRAYAGDLIPVENGFDDNNNVNEEDSVQKVVYLKMPENAKAGVYDLEIKVYNSDTETTVRKTVGVGAGASAMVLAAVKNQDMKAGETKTYDLVIVNSANKVKVFNINAVSGTALSVSVPSVVTVGAGSSVTVPVTVRASNDASVGAYTFSVNVDGETVVFGANVSGGSAGVSTSVVALTVVLVIIFVVLLIVLIVLLTRKEQTIQEVETSYY